MYKPRFYYDTGANGSGGNMAPSLADIGVNGDGNSSTSIDTGGIQGGDGSQKLPNLEPAAEPAEGVNSDGTIKDGYVKGEDGKVSKAPAPPVEPVEGVNEDGTLQEGYIKDTTTGVVSKDPNYQEPADDPFWENVEKITGTKIEVEYPEGIDPLSPEGAAIRDLKTLETGALQFEEYLKTTNPRAYSFFIHTNNGGKEEDFFGTNQGYTLPTKEELTASADAQAAVYKYDLTSKGLDEDAAEALVQKAIKDNKLLEKSTTSYGTIEAAQVKQLADLQRQAADVEAAERTAITGMQAVLDKAINSDLSFIIPDNAKPEFRKYVLENIRFQDGKFYVVQELVPDTMKNQLEALLFQHKKGDLSKIIKKAAGTNASQRLSSQVRKTETGKTKDEGIGKSGSTSLTLGQVAGWS